MGRTDKAGSRQPAGWPVNTKAVRVWALSVLAEQAVGAPTARPDGSTQAPGGRPGVGGARLALDGKDRAGGAC